MYLHEFPSPASPLPLPCPSLTCQYAEYIKLLHEVFSEERAIEEIHKAAGIAQQHVTRAQKNVNKYTHYTALD